MIETLENKQKENKQIRNHSSSSDSESQDRVMLNSQSFTLNPSLQFRNNPLKNASKKQATAAHINPPSSMFKSNNFRGFGGFGNIAKQRSRKQKKTILRTDFSGLGGLGARRKGGAGPQPGRSLQGLMKFFGKK
jgi:hypothetical protein